MRKSDNSVVLMVAARIGITFKLKYLLVGIALLSATTASATHQQDFSLHIDVEHVDISAQRQSGYREYLHAALIGDDQHNISLGDIRITDNPSILPGWHRSRYFIDSVPALRIFHLKQTSLQLSSKAKVGLVARDYLLSTTNLWQVIPNDSSVVQLLNSKRFVGVIDYAQNTAKIEVDPDVTSQPYSDARPLYVHFRDPRLVRRFDDYTQTKLTDNPMRQSTDLLGLQPGQQNDKGKAVRWVVLSKVYDPENRVLEPIQSELSVSRWLQQQLPDYDLRIETGSSKSAFEDMQREALLCVLNVSKKAERDDIAYFTVASQYYLGQRLYIKKQHPRAQAVTQLAGAEPVLLADLLGNLTDLNIAYTKPRSDAAIPEMLQARSQGDIAIEVTEIRKGKMLIAKGRVDLLMQYSAFFETQEYEGFKPEEYLSFALADSFDHRAAYIACSKTPQGQDFVERLNAELTSKHGKDFLIQTYTAELPESDKQAVARAFNSLQ